MRVAIVAAMPNELHPLVKALNLQRSGDDYVGTVAGHDVVAAKMGVGMTGASRTTERLLDRGDIDRVVVIGICGGLDETVPIASVISPAVIVDGATGVEYKAPAWDAVRLDGRLVTFDDFALEIQMIPTLAKEGASAVDMETAAVAAACEKRGVPYAVFRSISDYATDGTVDLELGTMVKPDGSPKILAGIVYMLKRPWKIPRLIRLGKDSAAASKAAVDAAIGALSA